MMIESGGPLCTPGPDQQGRLYTNLGNPPLLDLLGPTCRRILDVGCGAGDNAALIRARHIGCRIVGITKSPAEAALARPHMDQCWVCDVEQGAPDELEVKGYEVLLFSHVLEHLRDPAVVLAQFTKFLEVGGDVLIAVPNVLSWRMRVEFLLGRFEYESAGVLDDTHLRFFTYNSADRYLLARSPGLELVYKGVTGSVPHWWLRRYVFPGKWSRGLDAWGSSRWPNLFGWQVLIKAKKVRRT